MTPPDAVHRPAGPVVIEPVRPWSLGLRGLWEFRELLYFLVQRDVKVRYKQTFFGAAWAIIQPLLLMVVFGLFFGRLAGLPSEGIPYPVFALAALVPWTLFANALSGSSQSVVMNERLVSKVFFPRLVVPISAAGSFVVDFVISVVVLLVVSAGYGVYPSVRLLLVPLLGVFALVAAFSVGIWLAALNVRYRDVRYALPFLVQLLMFTSPVAYASSLVPDRWRLVYGLNPLVGIIDAFRWSAVGAKTAPGAVVAVSAGMTVLLLVGGLLYFSRTEQSFADVI
jgi:lipopolysaccharide transport system permease protein